jgi:hypothetical protein
MTLRRFQQIRAVFHANDNTKMAGSNDFVQSSSCFELFETDPSYLDVGDELALMRPVFLRSPILCFQFSSTQLNWWKFSLPLLPPMLLIVCMCAT